MILVLFVFTLAAYFLKGKGNYLFLALLAVLLLFPIPMDFNVPNFLVFVLAVFLLSILSNYLRRNLRSFSTAQFPASGQWKYTFI